MAVLKKPSLKLQKSESFSHGIRVKQGKKATPTSKVRNRTTTSKSPFVGFSNPAPAVVRAFHRKLAQVFGERVYKKRRGDILATVVGTILSQNTTNTNSHMAFVRLKKAFPTWDKVRQAKASQIEEAIRCGGLAPKKAKWIQTICNAVHEETGSTSMDHLRKMSKAEVHAYLGRFTGIGKKTAAIINLFDIGHPDMAVDTHVFRYAMQLGWVPSDDERARHNKRAGKGERWPVVTRDSCYAHIDALMPDDLKFSMHLILTDTEGGLPTVCPASKVVAFDGNHITVDGEKLKK